MERGLLEDLLGAGIGLPLDPPIADHGHAGACRLHEAEKVEVRAEHRDLLDAALQAWIRSGNQPERSTVRDAEHRYLLTRAIAKPRNCVDDALDVGFGEFPVHEVELQNEHGSARAGDGAGQPDGSGIVLAPRGCTGNEHDPGLSSARGVEVADNAVDSLLDASYVRGKRPGKGDAEGLREHRHCLSPCLHWGEKAEADEHHE
jgi:hypothetical protein